MWYQYRYLRYFGSQISMSYLYQQRGTHLFPHSVRALSPSLVPGHVSSWRRSQSDRPVVACCNCDVVKDCGNSDPQMTSKAVATRDVKLESSNFHNRLLTGESACDTLVVSGLCAVHIVHGMWQNCSLLLIPSSTTNRNANTTRNLAIASRSHEACQMYTQSNNSK